MDVVDERHYAWRMLRAARRAHADVGNDAEQASPSIRNDINALLNEAMDAGLDRTELVAMLADLGGRLLMLCDHSGNEARPA